MSVNQLIVNHILAMPFNLEQYKYYVNQNMRNSHFASADTILSLVSSFFEDSRKALICEELIRSRQSFEIDTVNQKIFRLETDIKKEREKVRQKNLRSYYTMEAWEKENAIRQTEGLHIMKTEIL